MGSACIARAMLNKRTLQPNSLTADAPQARDCIACEGQPKRGHPMTYVKNPITGQVRYVTASWAYWLKSYTWEDATFDEFMKYAISRLNVTDKPIVTS